MAKMHIPDKLKNAILLTAGSLIYALSLSCFLDPNRLAPGGVSGIAVIVNHTVGWIGTGTVIIILNIPLLIAGMVKFGRRFMISTVYATVLSSVLVELFNLFGSHASSFGHYYHGGGIEVRKNVYLCVESAVHAADYEQDSTDKHKKPVVEREAYYVF